MNIFLIGVAVLFGLIVGSFLNVCIYRIPRQVSIVKGNSGRSMCPDCGKTLKSYDLVPVFSYVFLRGKCRYCKKVISFRYPAIELANAIFWGLCAYMFGYEWKTLIYCVYCSLLLTLSMIDWDTQEIPYRFQVVILFLAAVSLFVPGFPAITERLIGMVVVSVPMIILTLLMNGFGGGDIQLMAASGLLIGWKASLVAMLIGTILAAVVGIVLLRRNRKKAGKTIIPFGPYLAVGLVISIFWGDTLINWYLTSFVL